MNIDNPTPWADENGNVDFKMFITQDKPKASGLGYSSLSETLSDISNAFAAPKEEVDSKDQMIESLKLQNDQMYNNLMADGPRSISPTSGIPVRSDSGIGNKYYDTVSNIESKGDYGAVNKSSGATGRYQFFETTAGPYLAKMGSNWNEFKTNPAIQDSVMKSFTEDNARFLRKNGIAVNDVSLWTAHNQGRGGARSIFQRGTANIKNLSSNMPAGMEPTGSNYVNYWSKRFV